MVWGSDQEDLGSKPCSDPVLIPDLTVLKMSIVAVESTLIKQVHLVGNSNWICFLVSGYKVVNETL